MSIKSILPLAATAAVATLALTGCTQNNAAPADSSATQAPAASAPAGSGEASATQAPAAPSSAPSAPAAQDNSGALTVDESNQHLTIPAGTTKVIINGSNNAIEVDSASSVSFTGSNNELEYKKGNAPRVANDIGANNVVSQD